MNTSLELSTMEIRARHKKNLINKWFLGTFLVVGIIALFLKLVDGVLLDYGFGIDKELKEAVRVKEAIWNTLHISAQPDWKFTGVVHTFHPGFWSDPLVARIASDPDSYEGAHRAKKEFASIIAMYRHHPNSVWLLTQFTWLTTIIVLLFLVFRFFRYEDTLPRWLKWIMTQRTLTLLTIYDAIVGIVFWIGMFKDFDSAFNTQLRVLEMIVTILVHAFIPIFLITYSFVFVIKDKKASALKEAFILKGMIYPIVYFSYYVLLTGIWHDPYNITQMHDSLIHVNKNLYPNASDTLSGHTWVSELWKMFLVVAGMWVLIGMMILVHNVTLIKLNKSYNPKKDFEILARRERKIQKIKSSVTRKCARKSDMEFELIESKIARQNEDHLKILKEKRNQK